MPVTGLRVQAYQLLGLAIKADEEGRSSDAYDLTARAIEHLEDARNVDKLRRTFTPNEAASNKQYSALAALDRGLRSTG